MPKHFDTSGIRVEDAEERLENVVILSNQASQSPAVMLKLIREVALMLLWLIRIVVR